MLSLSLEVEGKTTSDLVKAIDEARRRIILKDATSGFDRNESSRFNFLITGKEEAEEPRSILKDFLEWRKTHDKDGPFTFGGNNLRIEVDPMIRQELKNAREEDADYGGLWNAECEFLESLRQSGTWWYYEQVSPEETGDLLGDYCPIIGIREEAEPELGDVAIRWAYMDYAVRSFLDDIVDKGYCIFQGTEISE